MLLVGGCDQSDHKTNVATADIADAARSAQDAVDQYGDATRPEPRPLPSADAPAAANDPAQPAADIVQRYFALIEGGEYNDAWALWDDRGGASGMTADAFAASFGKFASYHAQVGLPGRIEADAGQRHVTIPVRIAGRLREDGTPFVLAGPVTLRRAAEQHSWRIVASALKPRPTEAAGADTTAAIVTARYACGERTQIAVRFDDAAGTAALAIAGAAPVMLVRQRVAAGISYAGGGYALRGSGRDATLTSPQGDTLACTAAE